MNHAQALSTLVAQLTATKLYASVRCVEERFVMVKLAGGETVVIFLLDRDVPVGILKKAMRDNTTRGIHTLFVLWAGRLPADGDMVELSAGVNALRTLYHDKVYAYEVVENKVAIFPVQLRAQDRSLKRHIIYEPAVRMDGLACQHIETAFPMQGFWATAGFYPKKHYEPNPTRQEYAPPPSNHRPDNSTSNTRRHYIVLGVRIGAGEEEIRQAYRQLARQFHPDLNTSEDATKRMQEINQAYRELMRHFEEK